MKILCIGDAMIPAQFFIRACSILGASDGDVRTTMWLDTDKTRLQNERMKIETGGPSAVPVPQSALEHLVDSEILLVHYCPVSAELIAAAPKLRVIGVSRGGVENIDVAAANSRGIAVVRISGRNADAVSDFTIGLMLAELRNIARSHSALMKGQWRKDFSNFSWIPQLKDKVIGIVGLGKIGSLVARKLQGFNVTLIGFDPHVDPEQMRAAGIDPVELDELMSRADIVTLHARLTPSNKGLVGAQQLKLMKPTSILVNTARAGLVDEDALATALEQGQIGGAALDVFSQEPLPPNHRFLKLDNVTLTSHLGGTTAEALSRSPELLCEQVRILIETGHAPDLFNPEVLAQATFHSHVDV